ncbi:MAG: hypothetical protein ACK5LP_07190 [Campylobacteraceae bacterium]
MSKKYFQHSLSKQFRERCMSMSAWAEKNNINRSLLTMIANGSLKGKRKGQTQNIIKKLKEEGFELEEAV